MVRREEEPDRLQLSDKQIEGLCQGQLIHEAGAPNDTGPHLWVPAAREETLWAVARVSEPVEGRFAPSARAASGKLGEFGAIALVNAARAEELERSALRDPRTGLHTTTFLEEAVARVFDKIRREARVDNYLTNTSTTGIQRVSGTDTAGRVRTSAGSNPPATRRRTK